MGITRFINSGGFVVPVFGNFTTPSGDTFQLGATTLNLSNTFGPLGALNLAGQSNLGVAFTFGSVLSTSGDQELAQLHYTPVPTSGNMHNLIAAGHQMPALDTWWAATPSGDSIRNYLSSRGDHYASGVRRIYIPRPLQEGVNFDEERALAAKNQSWGAQAYALWAQYLRVIGSGSDADTWMTAASGWFLDPGYDGLMRGSNYEHSLQIALDWIEWPSATHWENAFEIVRAVLESGIVSVGRKWPDDGYFDTNHPGASYDADRTLLALQSYGINPGGASHVWASGVIDKISAKSHHTGADPDAAYDLWEWANTGSIISMSGGGDEFGMISYGYGGYDAVYLGVDTCRLLPAIDSIFGSNTFTNSLYVKTRRLSHLAMLSSDSTIEHSRGVPMLMMGRGLGGEDGGRYNWLYQQYTGDTDSSNFMELQACLGPLPTPIAPSTVPPIADVLGSVFHVMSNPSDPSGTFHFASTLRTYDLFRFTHGERTFWFREGTLGLVDSRANRGAINAGIANGFWFSDYDASGDPKVLTGTHRHEITEPGPYVDKTQEDALYDTNFLQPNITYPTLNSSGHFEWYQDYDQRIGKDGSVGVGITGTCATKWVLDSGNKRLVMTDQLNIATGLYLGWHFSPTHNPEPISNGFQITDGTNTIQVTIFPLDSGVTLEKTLRPYWFLEDAQQALDYFNNVRGVPVSSVAYVPTPRLAEHNVRTIVELL